MASNS
jgi:hypothetical protein